MPGILKKMLRHGHEEQKLDTPKNTSSSLDEGANMFTYKLIEVWSFLVQVDEFFFFSAFSYAHLIQFWNCGLRWKLLCSLSLGETFSSSQYCSNGIRHRFDL